MLHSLQQGEGDVEPTGRLIGTHRPTCTVAKGSRFTAVVTILLLIALLFESIAFGVFTASMLWDQMSAIFSDETYIEQLKKVSPQWEKKARWVSMKSVFGHPFSMLWFSPFATPRTASCSPHLHTV
ncbi:hypothetical protein ACOMHN_041173 [Nucella lapillus]